MQLDSRTLVDLLSQRSKQTPGKIAYTFLQDGEQNAVTLTYSALDRRARTIAANLQQYNSAGERALLLYPSSLEYIVAFFGCLYANVLAVPLYPPHARRVDQRIKAVAEDAKPKFALTTAKICAKIKDKSPYASLMQNIEWIATDELCTDQQAIALVDQWHYPELTDESLAYLQYTSGSTSVPKGVMVSHENLLYNLRDSYASLEHKPDDVMVSWLPLFHDMGLILCILYPLYMGIHGVIMPPTAFIEKPIRWLNAISRYRGTHSAAPNFAYEYCLEKIPAEARTGLDLSSWRHSANGSEPIRATTMTAFAEGFKECGFAASTLTPCYGLAEATLKVTSTPHGSGAMHYLFTQDGLAKNRVVTSTGIGTSTSLVACGVCTSETQIIIVDPATKRLCAHDEIGEIWVSGPTVAQGYWQNKEATQETFHAYLNGSTDGPFLRTGDLGFLYEGQLFITGRLKDLIIIRGRNHYPQDIEMTAARCHPALHPDQTVAFSVAANNGVLGLEERSPTLEAERLVIVLEVERTAVRSIQSDEVIWAIRNAVAEEHDIRPYAVLLTKPGNIPKTTSGKLQRQACRDKYNNNQMAILGKWQADEQMISLLNITTDDIATVDLTTGTELAAELIQEKLCQWLAQRLQVSREMIAANKPLVEYGLDSLMIFELRDALYHSLNVEIALTDLFDLMTIEDLTQKVQANRSHVQTKEHESLTGTNGILTEGKKSQTGTRVRISI